jgi:GWxTD domain-containing protein
LKGKFDRQDESMKVHRRLFILAFLISSLIINSNGKNRERDLPQKYKEWLKLTRYIILPQEKETFMQLTTERDRDIFIKAFWQQRDPTPGTPQNEYKEEHLRRFLYANKFLKRDSPREGWMTDMGRMHIILGPPHSIERFDGTAGIHPCQVWYYYGDNGKDLPVYFALVFYQRGGSGEYKLYNPISDGPSSLLIEAGGMNSPDYRQVYQKIKKLAPSLAGVAISMIPGQLPQNYQPSPQSNIILAAILESPKKDVAAAYATHFLNYKGVVSTEYLTNYIESSGHAALIRDPLLNMNFVHLSISPKSVSIDYFEPKDQYYCNFQLNVSVRGDERLIFQYSKDFPFYFNPQDMERIKANGISIQDSFPLIEGKYRIDVLIQNSVGKEFSVFEKDISVPETSENPQIIGPVIGYKTDEYTGHFHEPFKVMNRKLLVDPQNTISLSEELAIFFNLVNMNRDLWESGQVILSVKMFDDQNPSPKTYVLKTKDYPYNEILAISHTLLAREFSPDYYEIHLILEDGKGNAIDEKKSNFILSPQEEIPHPVTLAKSFPASNNYLYFYAIANQYDKAKEFDKAEACYEKAFKLMPTYNQGIVEYSYFLFKIKKFSRSAELIENIKDDQKLKFQYFLIKGKSLAGMEQYSEAIKYLLEGNRIYNSETSLLNSLGLCYYRIGEKEKALEVLKSSLGLDSSQQNISQLIENIERSRR